LFAIAKIHLFLKQVFVICTKSMVEPFLDSKTICPISWLLTLPTGTGQQATTLVLL